MTALRFPRSVYAGTAIDEALKLYAAYGSFERREEPVHWVVELAAGSPAAERQLAGELGNYALGLTIRGRGVR